MGSVVRIGLLDVDGVCLKPGGYRAAYQAAVAHFLGLPGSKELLSIDKAPELFESRGITNEWDMIGLTLALVYDSWESYSPGLLLNKKLSDLSAEDGLDYTGLENVAVNFEESIRKIGNYLKEGIAPSKAVLEVVSSGQAGSLMSNVPQSLLIELLNNTRDVINTCTTQIFQNYVLGHKRFKETYGFNAQIKTESYLKIFDSSNLRLDTLGLINTLMKADEARFCIYTARPSLPPRSVNVSSQHYSPEAEMAVELVGLTFLPMIAFGRLQYAAETMDLNLDALVKPSPVQALAAIAAAWLKDEVAALKWAVRFWQSTQAGRQKFLIDLPGQLEIHVFEDSPPGIFAVKKAVEMLKQAGLGIQLTSWGISTVAQKIIALEDEGARVLEDINDALQIALAS
jgi:hypothetical protein